MSKVHGALGVLAGLLVLPVACSTAGDPQTTSGRTAFAYETAVRTLVSERDKASTTTESTDDADDRPVVYVVAVEGTSISVAVQAKVAEKLVDEMDVRFADDRDEAIESDEPEEPVRSHGLLLIVGEVPEEPGPFELQVERYTSLDDHDLVTMSFAPSGEEWRVTSTSLSAGD